VNQVPSILPHWLLGLGPPGIVGSVILFATGLVTAAVVALCAILHIRARFQRHAREIADANRRFQVTFDQAAVGICHMAPDGHWLRLNDRFCEIVGFPPEDLLGRSFRDVTHPDDVARDVKAIDDLLAGVADRMAIEKRYIRKDGTIVWANVTRNLVRDAAGAPDFLVSVAQDISSRKEAEGRLVTGEAQYRAIFDSAVEAVTVIDSAGIIQSANPSVERIFGYAPDELIGRSIGILMPEPDRSRHLDYIAHYLETGERAVIGIGREVEGLRKDGTTFPLELSVAEWKHGDHSCFTGIMRDISDRREAEEALLGSEERLRLLQNQFAYLARVNDLGEMAAAIAHEINQPLAAIVNYLNSAIFLADTGGYTEQNFAYVTEDMNRASEQALRAGEIVRRLRAFISQGAGVRTIEPVARLVDGAMALALLDAKYSGITVETDIQAEGVSVEVDTIQIHQVIVNLLRNAVEAMIGSPSDRERILTVSARLESDDLVTFSVADTGPGISPDVYEHLFEPFVTSKMNGMGMGLSLCQRLIESHSGTISVENLPGLGAKFTFSLPRFYPNRSI
jgi:two-component system sensor kinase FixL